MPLYKSCLQIIITQIGHSNICLEIKIINDQESNNAGFFSFLGYFYTAFVVKTHTFNF